MAATSEDEDRTPVSSSGVQSATDSYEGDETESYPGEDDDDVNLSGTMGADGEEGFDEDSEFDDDFEDGEFDDDDDEGDYEGEDDVDNADDAGAAAHGSLNGFDDNDSSDRVPRTRSGIRSGRETSAHPPPPLPQHNFAPPFYGRPPTPLPPSPSLTSLLRPSRPTTPDATDDELEPVPRAAPQVPTYEYYGFVLYLFSSLAFLMYLLWSYLPSPFLHALGIYYYPNRWWSLAIPSFLVMTLVYIYVALASYNTEILTLPLDSIETIVDGAAKLAAVDEDGCVIIIGGPDGSQVQGRGLTAGDIQQKKDQGHQRQASYGQPPWSKQQFTHQRSPSSPSPPLGKPAWRDRPVKSRDRKSKKTSTADATSSNNDSSTRTSTTTPEDGITMGRGREWSGRSSRGTDASSNRNDANGSGSGSGHSSQGYGYISHRSPSDWNRLWNVGTDAVMDIPLAGVCEVLYA